MDNTTALQFAINFGLPAVLIVFADFIGVVYRAAALQENH